MTALNYTAAFVFWVSAAFVGILLAPWYTAWKTKRKEKKMPPKKRKPRIAKAKTEEGAGAEAQHAKGLDMNWKL